MFFKSSEHPAAYLALSLRSSTSFSKLWSGPPALLCCQSLPWRPFCRPGKALWAKQLQEGKVVQLTGASSPQGSQGRSVRKNLKQRRAGALLAGTCADWGSARFVDSPDMSAVTTVPHRSIPRSALSRKPLLKMLTRGVKLTDLTGNMRTRSVSGCQLTSHHPPHLEFLMAVVLLPMCRLSGFFNLAQMCWKCFVFIFLHEAWFIKLMLCTATHVVGDDKMNAEVC